MGNYYEGSIYFKLKENTPKNLMDLIKFLDEDYFELGSNRLTFHQIMNKFNIECSNSQKYSEVPSVEILDDKMIKFSICTKHFNNNSILWMIDLYKPYMAIENKNDNYLGTIQDEDGYYYKDFYIDDSLFKQEQKNREYICNKSCSDYNDNYLCDYYDNCKRCYQLGKINNTTSDKIEKVKTKINQLTEYDTEVVHGLIDTTIRKSEVLSIIDEVLLVKLKEDK